MIKARSGQHLFFGLSARNVELLQAGRPIHFDLATLGMKGRITIFYGETEQKILEEFKRVGLLPADDDAKGNS